MSVKPIPDGHSTVIPYFVVANAAQLIEFLTKAFDARLVHQTATPNGIICHAHVRVGDSSLMMGQAPAEKVLPAAALYMYVTDVDAAYRRAIEAGATAVAEPANQFYGDRVANLKDPAGNNWWIATHVEDMSDDELAKRMATARK